MVGQPGANGGVGGAVNQLGPSNLGSTGYGTSEPRLTDAQLRTLGLLLDRQQFASLAGLQFGGARDLYSIFGYDRIVTTSQYRDEYARGGLAKRIVDCFPKATWRGGVELYEDEDPEVSTTFEEAWASLEQRLHVWNALQNADILAGQSTYSVILLGAPGELDTELPRVKGPDALLYLQPFFGGGGPGNQSRGLNVNTQAADADVTIETFDVDPTSARFGEAVTYRIRRTDFASPSMLRSVHWSRIVHVCEGALDNRVYGVPTLESVWNLLGDLAKVTGGGAESFFQRAKHAMNLNIQKDVSFTDPDLAALKDKFEEFQHGITTMMPTRGVDVKLIEAAVANFSAPADAILKQIAGAKGIPLRILTGSEMGTLASEQDAENFDSQVQDRRTGYAGPMIVRKLVDRLVAYGYLPTPARYDVGWPVKENLDQTGKADVALKMVQTNKEQSGVVFTEAEVREQSFGFKPLPETASTDQLSQSQKAEIAAKLALTNKEMGITVFTDDEIRKITYGFAPLPDSEKVPIGAPERISVTQPPELGADGLPVPQPVTPGSLPSAVAGARAALRAAGDDELLRVLEDAIRAGNADVVLKVVGLSAMTAQEAVDLLSKDLGAEGLVLAKGFVASLGDRLVMLSEEDLFVEFEAYRTVKGTGFDGRLLGDTPGHEFHGNQYTPGGASGIPHEYHATNDKLKPPSKPDPAKNEHVDFKGRPVKNGDKKAFSNYQASAKWANDLRAKGWNVKEKNTTVGYFNQHANTPNLFPYKVVIDGRRSRVGE